ncbi:hypoxia induced protein conserved region domain-containing protein [Ditylenchus destructor]|uniref:Hypoxia induced protein conserved region domain-containing protein n=1 Tax=Ditylenchus destructor TaxID=166010 RepID=A0AAD4NKL0_9BILA|nr:hypoxia induced protein conserved region domain-containing protein [Ditylenchus destructor]
MEKQPAARAKDERGEIPGSRNVTKSGAEAATPAPPNTSDTLKYAGVGAAVVAVRIAKLRIKMLAKIPAACRPAVSGSSSALFASRLGRVSFAHKYNPHYYSSTFSIMDVYKRKGPPRKPAIEGEIGGSETDMKQKFGYTTHEQYLDKKLEQRWNRTPDVGEDVKPTMAQKRRLVLTMLYPNLDAIPEYVAFNIMEKMKSRMRVIFYLTLSIIGFTFMYVILIGLHYRILQFALLFEKYFLHTMRTFGRALSAVLAARVVHATVPGGLVFKTEDEKNAHGKEHSKHKQELMPNTRPIVRNHPPPNFDQERGEYTHLMSNPIVIIGSLTVLYALWGMARNIATGNTAKANKYMQLRVAAQGGTALFLAMAATWLAYKAISDEKATKK